MEILTETKVKHWRLKFLDALRMSGIVTQAAMEAGIDRDTAYYERQRDPAFAQEWADALDRGVDMLEDVAKKRAYEGSDTLLIFLLKAHRPDRYRETTRTIQVNVTPDDLQHMSDEELDALDAQLKSLDRR
jgi:hypothetical protein